MNTQTRSAVNRLVGVFQIGQTEYRLFFIPEDDHYMARRIDIVSDDLLEDDADLNMELYLGAFDDDQAVRIVIDYATLEEETIFP